MFQAFYNQYDMICTPTQNWRLQYNFLRCKLVSHDTPSDLLVQTTDSELVGHPLMQPKECHLHTLVTFILAHPVILARMLLGKTECTPYNLAARLYFHLCANHTELTFNELTCMQEHATSVSWHLTSAQTVCGLGVRNQTGAMSSS